MSACDSTIRNLYSLRFMPAVTPIARGRERQKSQAETKSRHTFLTRRLCTSSSQGYGIFWSKNGDRYEGEWVGGRRNGKGRQTYGGRFPDGFGGDLYEGEWLDDRRHGLGFFEARGDDENPNRAGWLPLCPVSLLHDPPVHRSSCVVDTESKTVVCWL